MATRKTTVAAQTEPAPIEPTSTEPVTLPELPPAETFVGLVAYGVDTTNDRSVHIPLEFVAQGAQAAVDAARAAHTATEHANAATTATQQATTAANTATETANTAAADLEQLKTDCAEATIAANTAAETANKQATAAHTAAASANNAAEIANTKAGEAANAAESANAAATRANEAAQNITDDVSALVLTQANKPRIQALAGIDYSKPGGQLIPGEYWPDLVTGAPKKVYATNIEATLPEANSSTIIVSGVSDFRVVAALCDIGIDYKINENYISVNNDVAGFKYYYYFAIINEDLRILNGGSEVVGKKVRAIIKYTK